MTWSTIIPHARFAVGQALNTPDIDLVDSAATKRLKAVGVIKINTLVVWDDPKMVPFFSSFGFNPSPTINLELIP